MAVGKEEEEGEEEEITNSSWELPCKVGSIKPQGHLSKAEVTKKLRALRCGVSLTVGSPP